MIFFFSLQLFTFNLKQAHECFYISCPEHHSKVSFSWMTGNDALHFYEGDNRYLCVNKYRQETALYSTMSVFTTATT